jgi:hypothetical protein
LKPTGLVCIRDGGGLRWDSCDPAQKSERNRKGEESQGNVKRDIARVEAMVVNANTGTRAWGRTPDLMQR